jgi:hypothetical protein
MKHSTKVTECPKCGGKELGKGKRSGYGAMFPVNKMNFVGAAFLFERCSGS